MSWENMDSEYLRMILDRCFCDSEDILWSVYRKGEKSIRAFQNQVGDLIDQSISCRDVYSCDTVKKMVYSLFASYRRALNSLVQKTQLPDAVELLLDAADARRDTIELLDRRTDGIFVYRDGDCLRLRTPPLPHRSKPVIYMGSGSGLYPVTTTRIYGEAVLRVMEEAQGELGSLYDSLGRKTVHILNVFGPGDVLVFDSVSRMSRNAEEGFELYKELIDGGVELHFLKEGYIDSTVYQRAMKTAVPMTGTAVDVILKGVNEYMLILAQEQIRVAFDQSEKEVADLRQRTREGLVTAKANGSQVGRVTGSTYETKKAARCKEIIRTHSKSFGGTLSDAECITLCGCIRNAYYNYKRQAKGTGK